ncbi:MAG: GNAT family N-acetyltransferase [Bacteroidota bacterium]
MNLIIETKRLVLTPFGLDDADLFHQLNINPYIKEFLWDSEQITLDEAREIMLKNERHFEKDSFGLWMVKLKDTEETIGYTGLWYFFGEKQPQLVYALLQQFTKQGYAKEFSKAIIRYSFETLNFKYLIAATDEPHLASQKVAKSVGMKLQERRIENGKPTLFFKIEKGRK